MALGGANLVAHVGEEGALGAGGRFGQLLRLFQFGGAGRHQFLEVAAVAVESTGHPFFLGDVGGDHNVGKTRFSPTGHPAERSDRPRRRCRPCGRSAFPASVRVPGRPAGGGRWPGLRPGPRVGEGGEFGFSTSASL